MFKNKRVRNSELSYLKYPIKYPLLLSQFIELKKKTQTLIEENTKLQTALSNERTKHLKIDIKVVEESEKMWKEIALRKQRENINKKIQEYNKL